MHAYTHAHTEIHADSSLRINSRPFLFSSRFNTHLRSSISVPEWISIPRARNTRDTLTRGGRDLRLEEEKRTLARDGWERGRGGEIGVADRTGRTEREGDLSRTRTRNESRVRSVHGGHRRERRELLKRSFRHSLLGEKSACARAAPIRSARDVSHAVRHGIVRIRVAYRFRCEDETGETFRPRLFNITCVIFLREPFFFASFVFLISVT